MSSLFDTPENWRADPSNAFAAFVLAPEFLALSKRLRRQEPPAGAAMPIRASSARMYVSMFRQLLQWLSTQNKTLFDITSADLMMFLQRGSGAEGKKVLNSAVRQQYLGLLDRVYTHLKVPNPARDACFAIYKSGDRALLGKNDRKVVLTDAQQAAFMQALPVAAPGSPEDPSTGWKRRRDRAMQAMMLGAGLKVSEVSGIYSDNVHDKDSAGSASISISPASAGGLVRHHQTQLRPFAVPEVMQWITERHALKIPGPLLFPASLGGGRLNNATVYRQVRATFERAGIAAARLGGRTLRNAFAVRELNAGGSMELVGEFMGHRLRRSTQMYSPKLVEGPLTFGEVLAVAVDGAKK
jgi:site-specific recombinase XerD